MSSDNLTIPSTLFLLLFSPVSLPAKLTFTRILINIESGALL